MLKEGLEYTTSITVEEHLTALAMGSGDMQVYATPAVVALMENAAMMCVSNEIGEGNATVGAAISTSHIKASGLGEKITAKATLIKVEGRKLEFSISAKDSTGASVAEGEHTRFIVDRVKFLSKLNQ